jgi:Arc/MetJ-type ribon-helix-helix transcriptional regulator
MRNSRVLSITIPPAMLKQAERVARKENRTMSELVREALRSYFTQREYRELQAFGIRHARRLGIGEQEVDRLIQEDRRESRKQC